MHIVGVYDGTQAMVYLNGELKDTHPITGTVNAGQVATLGKTGTTYLQGSVDQVEVYGRALTGEEIGDMYAYYMGITDCGSYELSQEVVISSGETYTFPDGSVGTEDMVQVIELTSPEGCEAVVTTTLTVQPSGMAHLAQEHFAVYPNPSDGIFTLQTDEKTAGQLYLEIFNGNGQRVYHRVITAPGRHPVDLSASPEGIYMVRVSDGTGSWRKRVVIL